MGRALVTLLLLTTFISCIAAMEVTCTRLNRKCIDHAPCVNRTCLCPQTQHGDAQLACANENENICLIRADPHTLTYGLAKANICIPCRYRVALFKVQIEGKPSQYGCNFEVFAFNMISQSGKFFVAGAEVSLRVGGFNAPEEGAEVIHFEINHAGIVTSKGDNALWGTRIHSNTMGVTIDCIFEVDGNFAILKVRECDTTIRFRSYNENDEPNAQVRMPGLAVISPERAVFPPGSEYPNYLCSKPTDHNDTLFWDRGVELGINNSHGAALHDVLQHGFEIGHDLLIQDQTKLLLPNAPECSRAVKAFRDCDADKRAAAVHSCMQLMSKRRMIRCLRRDVLEAFTFCLRVYCGKGDCFVLKRMLSRAMRIDKDMCSPPRRIRKNVNCTFPET
ncbi:uncharacterized protein LOC143297105 [Babylonia areolata]|uniref:uncharacterized protein LOC143297105 n=1 Tax=Babylonia areolata TaxID=304850 RepID=UPI003FD5F479